MHSEKSMKVFIRTVFTFGYSHVYRLRMLKHKYKLVNCIHPVPLAERKQKDFPMNLTDSVTCHIISC